MGNALGVAQVLHCQAATVHQDRRLLVVERPTVLAAHPSAGLALPLEGIRPCRLRLGRNSRLPVQISRCLNGLLVLHDARPTPVSVPTIA